MRKENCKSVFTRKKKCFYEDGLSFHFQERFKKFVPCLHAWYCQPVSHINTSHNLFFFLFFIREFVAGNPSCKPLWTAITTYNILLILLLYYYYYFIICTHNNILSNFIHPLGRGLIRKFSVGVQY